MLLLLVSSCSSNEEMPDERLVEKELYDQAQTRLKNGSFSTAILSLEALESRFPFGRYAEQAQAELIYAYYMNSQFEASQSASERFINLHPRHSHTGYAFYMKGLAAFTDDSGLFSRYFQSDLAKREVVMAQTSFGELSEFISRYPESKYVPHAKQRMIYLRNLLAEHEIYVADFFFTTCQTICPIMTKNMKEIQDKLINDKEILLLSHSVTPEIDSVGQLKKYAIANKINDDKWNLVTGDKKQIYNLARKSYLAVEDSEFGNFDMIHTENFMLIDKKRQIRGFYDGTEKNEIIRLLSDIEILKKLN